MVRKREAGCVRKGEKLDDNRGEDHAHKEG
jgi:hypothetical protein